MPIIKRAIFGLNSSGDACINIYPNRKPHLRRGKQARSPRKCSRRWATRGCAISPARRERILKECNDVLFYLSRISRELDSSFAELLQMSADKILDRKARGVILGSGDDR